MLENTITLFLNNGGTPINAVFARIDVFQNRSVYHGPGHSTVSPNLLNFYRTPSKASGNFLGVMKSAAKVTKATTVMNALGVATIVPRIGEMSFSVPVGATEANVDDLFDHLEGLIEGQRAVLKRTLFGPEI